VVGARLEISDASGAAVALLIAGAVVAAWLLPRAATAPVRTGSAFLVAVATLAISTLCSLVADSFAEALSAVVVAIALVALCAGLALYGRALWRFDRRELRGGAGDHWIAGGGLAIASVAASELGRALRHVGVWSSAADVAAGLSLVLWACAIAWLAALVVSELRWPRPWIDPRRWSSVFPLGMYAVASFSVGRLEGVPALPAFASVWIWVAFAAWAAALIGTLRARSHAPPGPRRGPSRAGLRAGSIPRHDGRRDPLARGWRAPRSPTGALPRRGGRSSRA
jgi:tellurite resistance protein TehA-like permease